MYALDVVVQTNANAINNPLLASFPTVPDHFELKDGLWIGRIEADAARKVFELNEPRYEGTPTPVIQYAQLYSYVREMKGPAYPYQWDTDGTLQTCVALLRLVAPTTISLRYSGRIRYNTDSSISDISPSDIRGVPVDTFLSGTSQRDWITAEEATRLKNLITKGDTKQLSARTSRALWYHEYATRTYYVELRWVYVATGLEALVHVGREYSGLQFRERVSKLARELGIDQFGPAEAKQAYHLRSQLAHGQQLGGLSAERDLYNTMETVLRLALLRSIEDDEFGDSLRDDQKIKKRWPVCL